MQRSHSSPTSIDKIINWQHDVIQYDEVSEDSSPPAFHRLERDSKNMKCTEKEVALCDKREALAEMWKRVAEAKAIATELEREANIAEHQLRLEEEVVRQEHIKECCERYDESQQEAKRLQEINTRLQSQLVHIQEELAKQLVSNEQQQGWIEQLNANLYEVTRAVKGKDESKSHTENSGNGFFRRLSERMPKTSQARHSDNGSV